MHLKLLHNCNFATTTDHLKILKKLFCSPLVICNVIVI